MSTKDILGPAEPVLDPQQAPLAPLLWLGERRGHLADWATQRWVELTGRRIDTDDHTWLVAPVGKTSGIGKRYFEELAQANGLELQRGRVEAGLLADFAELRSPSLDPDRVASAVVDFYEHTAAYEMDAWSEWCGAFRPFGWLLAIIFSRRLQQLNVPLSPLDTSRGLSSEILRLVEPASGRIVHTAWVRQLVGTGNVLYAASYSVIHIPGHDGLCVRVAFPLPNGNAQVFMKPEVHADGSFSVTSAGHAFGDPGFYFTIVRTDGTLVARHVRSLTETIRVYAIAEREVHAEHLLWLCGARVLRLHYRLRRIV